MYLPTGFKCNKAKTLLYFVFDLILGIKTISKYNRSDSTCSKPHVSLQNTYLRFVCRYIKKQAELKSKHIMLPLSMWMSFTFLAS